MFKWIGNNIFNLISRFREDVYLDSVSSGTIASGGNLGLDSKNKIVKATITSGSGDITGVDLTGGDAISISSETNTTSGSYSATINHDDTSSQASVNNSGSTYIQDVTLDTYGHVTALTSAPIPTLNQDTSGNAASATVAGGLSATLAVSRGGTGQTTIQAAMNSLAGGVTAGRYLRANGTNVVLSAIDNGDIGTLNQNTTGSAGTVTSIGNLTGDVTSSNRATTIANDAVTFAKASGVTPSVYGNVIKLIPSDFMSNDDGGNQKFGVGYVDDGGASTYGMRAANSATELYAFVSIPEGMKAVSVHIYDLNDLAIEVYEIQINANTMTSKGTGNCGTTLTLSSAVESSATNFLAIEITTTNFTNDRVYGGIVTIAAI